MKKIAIVPASGIGQRVGKSIPKQYMRLANGRFLIEQTLDQLCAEAWFDQIIVVLRSDDQWWWKTTYANDSCIVTCHGGKTRFESVYNGLLLVCKLDVDAQNDWVFVHDAARPLASIDLFKNLYETVIEQQAKGVIVAMPAHDTVKKVDQKTQRIIKTISRETIWLAQTPQLFEYGLLKQAMQYCRKHQIPVTDESSAVESFGYQPMIVEGQWHNIKVTVEKDLQFVNQYLCYSVNSNKEH